MNVAAYSLCDADMHPDCMIIFLSCTNLYTFLQFSIYIELCTDGTDTRVMVYLYIVYFT